MTEREWLRSDKPHAMLLHLRGRGSNRKLRLYACAVCRRFRNLLRDERSWRAVEVAEQYADGRTGYAALKAAQGPAQEAWRELDRAHRGAAWGTPEMWARRAAEQAAATTSREAWSAAWKAADEGQGGHPDALREIFGNPFRPTPIDPAWLAWNDGTVVKIAQAIYEERAFDRLPVLADALEEAGCTNAELLGHLRGPGPHARGCWALDLLLGKE
jgi:hypothetical protein